MCACLPTFYSHDNAHEQTHEPHFPTIEACSVRSFAVRFVVARVQTILAVTLRVLLLTLDEKRTLRAALFTLPVLKETLNKHERT